MGGSTLETKSECLSLASTGGSLLPECWPVAWVKVSSRYNHPAMGGAFALSPRPGGSMQSFLIQPQGLREVHSSFQSLSLLQTPLIYFLGNVMFPPTRPLPLKEVMLLPSPQVAREREQCWVFAGRSPWCSWDPQALVLGSFIDRTNSLTSSSKALFLLSTSSRERSTLRRLISKAADFFFSFSSSSLSLTTLVQTS